MNGMFYIVCPVCGHVQGKSGVGTNTEADCKKCKSTLSYKVLNNSILVEIIRLSTKIKPITI